jgi:aspartyl-tRNA(Asn)/glutamyl-tRNA(Gln) amidotransferase subunit B
MEYELVLGLEIHLQLKTKNKMFCQCNGLADRAEVSEPNTYVCPVCLGLPGALPVANKEAIILAQKVAYALGSNLSNHIIFERKNYFYPDLPKGYQITCPHDPISKGGEIDLTYWLRHPERVEGSLDKVLIRFREIHLEEDTGKSIHEQNQTLLDYNKSGLPLLEIVTEPDFKDVDHAIIFCKEVQRILRAIGASDADLEKGHMRLEANISVREIGQQNLPNYRVEIKNINSFSFLKKAINFEYNRQSEVLKSGGKLVQETRGFNENKNQTFSQRSKEEAHDYRYFPDPDIPVIVFDSNWMSEVMNELANHPNHKRKELISVGVSKQNIDILIDNNNMYLKFLKLIDLMQTSSIIDEAIAKHAANLVINVSGYKDFTAEEIFDKEKNKKENHLSEDELKEIITNVLDKNQKVVDEYNKGKENAIQFLIGQVMKEVKGKADANIVKECIIELLNS